MLRRGTSWLPADELPLAADAAPGCRDETGQMPRASLICPKTGSTAAFREECGGPKNETRRFPKPNGFSLRVRCFVRQIAQRLPNSSL